MTKKVKPYGHILRQAHEIRSFTRVLLFTKPEHHDQPDPCHPWRDRFHWVMSMSESDRTYRRREEIDSMHRNQQMHVSSTGKRKISTSTVPRTVECSCSTTARRCSISDRSRSIAARCWSISSRCCSIFRSFAFHRCPLLIYFFALLIDFHSSVLHSQSFCLRLTSESVNCWLDMVHEHLVDRSSRILFTCKFYFDRHLKRIIAVFTNFASIVEKDTYPSERCANEGFEHHLNAWCVLSEDRRRSDGHIYTYLNVRGRTANSEQRLREEKKFELSAELMRWESSSRCQKRREREKLTIRSLWSTLEWTITEQRHIFFSYRWHLSVMLPF